MFELRRIGIVKRASALLLDAILLAVLATGFMFVISLICDYGAQEAKATEYYEEWESFRKDCMAQVAQHYGFVYEETENGYTVTKDGQPCTLDDVLNVLNEKGQTDSDMAQIYNRFKSLPPTGQVNRQYQYVYSLLLMMISLGILLAYAVLEFIVPIILKNGQTVGKRVFSICLVRPDCVKISNLALFTRTFLGKFAFETMFPIMMIYMFLFGNLGLLALILVAALVILNIVLFFTTKNRTPIHDLLADTVAADKNLQMIFQSEEELIKKKTLRDTPSENSKI